MSKGNDRRNNPADSVGEAWEAEVRFILVPDPQALARLSPLLISLALSEPMEEGEGAAGKEAPKDSTSPKD